ncbi:MAG: hypothetical protein IK132_10135 [Clostridia bacterium]|nr:hypothetical protein [Clostridia bacterium]
MKSLRGEVALRAVKFAGWIRQVNLPLRGSFILSSFIASVSGKTQGIGK